MKRIISLVLLLVICMSFCACGEESENISKFVGTYNGYHTGTTIYGEKISYEEEMMLKKDGTGTLIIRCLNDCEAYNIKAGFELEHIDITWQESDGYLILHGTGTAYSDIRETRMINNINFEGTSVTYSITCEIRGNQLFNVEALDGHAIFTKIK